MSQITGLLPTLARADSLKSVDALKQAVNDGTIPGYIGVPMIADLIKKQQQAQGMAQQQPTQTVEDQVYAQAEQMQNPQPMPQQMPPQMAQQPPPQPMPQPVQPAGITGAQSNLPTQTMAGGGIVAFAGDTGSLVDDNYDPYEDEDNEEYYADIDSKNQMAKMIAQQAESSALTNALMQQSQEGQSGYGYGYGISPEAPSGSNIRPDAKGIAGIGFTDKLRHLESRGRDYDEKGNILTSPKGAMASMQTMPNTLKDPGFGVKPAQNNSVEEMNRVGRDYGNAMLQRYGNEKDAAMAYNWGPGNMDKWIAGGRKGPVPGETRQYASNFKQGGIVQLAGGGAVKHFVLGDLVIDDFGNTAGSDPRKALETDEFGRRIKDINKTEKVSREAQAYRDQMTRNKTLAAQPKAPITTSSGVGPLRGASIATLLPLAATSLYSGLTGPDNAKIPTAADINSGDLTKEEIEAAKHPAFIFPRMGKKRTAYNIPIRPGEEPTPINQTPYVAPPENKGPFEEDFPFSGQPFTMPEQLAPASTGPASTGPTTTTPAQATAEENLFKQMQKSYDERAASHKSEKELDNYLAVLQGFLGLAGGTSPYFATNVGTGFTSGIASLANARKQQGLTERGLGREQLGLFTAKQAMDRAAEDRGVRKDIAGTTAKNNQIKIMETAEKNRDAVIRKALEPSDMIVADLERREFEGKLDEAGKTKLQGYKERRKRIRDDIIRNDPLPVFGNVGGAGWSASIVKPPGT